VHSKRGAARRATAVLFADNSDEEPDELDEEDMNFINEDGNTCVDETIIGKLTFL
jgi:hypothetical protein